MKKGYLPKKESISKFTDRVLNIVSYIPRGQVMTYKQVAKAAGKPRAYRAVGNILNRNPHPVEVPCHRVVKSNGEVGGYVGGVRKKVVLLKKEGVIVRYDNRIEII